MSEATAIAAISPDAFDWRTDRTSGEWEQAARALDAYRRDSHRAARESLERCDTDGALSQWASDQTARKAEAAAALAHNHGRTEFPALFDLDTGEMVPAFLNETRYGMAWRITTSWGGSSTVKWVNDSTADSESAQRKHYAKHGYTEGTVLGRARLVARQTGYMQLTHVRIPVDRYDRDAFITVDTDSHTREHNTATLTWDDRNRAADVVLSGDDVRRGLPPRDGETIEAGIIRDGKEWAAEDRHGELIEVTRAKSWKAATNALIRYHIQKPTQFEIIHQ